MPASEPTEWRDTLRTELDSVNARISELEWAKQRRTRIDAQLREIREARRLDRERAVAALGRSLERVAVCGRVLEEAPARPRRCPGCGVAVVDPRGLDAGAIAEQLGTTERWLARADGLVSVVPCLPLAAARHRYAWLVVAALAAALSIAVLALITLAG
jgi:hypothetical protein